MARRIPTSGSAKLSRTCSNVCLSLSELGPTLIDVAWFWVEEPTHRPESCQVWPTSLQIWSGLPGVAPDQAASGRIRPPYPFPAPPKLMFGAKVEAKNTRLADVRPTSTDGLQGLVNLNRVWRDLAKFAGGSPEIKECSTSFAASPKTISEMLTRVNQRPGAIDCPKIKMSLEAGPKFEAGAVRSFDQACALRAGNLTRVRKGRNLSQRGRRTTSFTQSKQAYTLRTKLTRCLSKPSQPCSKLARTRMK